MIEILCRICEGTKDPSVVLREQINKYREVFKKAVEQVNHVPNILHISNVLFTLGECMCYFLRLFYRRTK